MSRRYLWLAVSLMTWAVVGCGGKSDPNPKPKSKDGGAASVSKKTKKPRPKSLNAYQFESAKIDFVYSGAFEGKETMYIADWGDTVVLVRDLKELGQKVNNTIIWNEGQTTIHDHITKTVSTSRLRVQATEPPSAGRVKESDMATVGYKKLPNETIAGMDCIVFDHDKLKVKYWLWKGMDLKIKNHSLGDGYTREAKSFQEDITIPADVLAAPADYKKAK